MTPQPDRLRRWQIWGDNNGTRAIDPDGEWVRYDDLLSLLRERDATITRLEQEREQFTQDEAGYRLHISMLNELNRAEERKKIAAEVRAEAVESALTLKDRDNHALARIQRENAEVAGQWSVRALRAEAALVALRQQIQQMPNCALSLFPGSDWVRRADVLALLPDEQPTPPEER